MQQSSATQSLHLSFWGLRKIVACSHSSSQCLLVSTVFGTVSSLHPTSFYYTCINRIANMHKSTGDKIGVPDNWVIYWLGDGATSVLPLRRHTDTSPIFSQRSPT